MTKIQKPHMETDGILVNRLDYKINEVKFDKKYTILHAEYKTYDLRKNAAKLLLPYKTVKAIRYEFGGTSFYFMLESSSEKEEICTKLKKLVLDEPITEEKCGSIAPDMLLELMMIGLSYDTGSDPDTDLAYSNLDGGVYTYEPSGVKKDRIITLNPKIRAAKDCTELFGDTKMTFPAQSFASVEKMRENPKDIAYLKTLARFETFENKYLKLSRNDEPELGVRQYVKHGYRGMNKASINFFDVSGVAGLDESKMGRIRKTLKKMRREYEGVDLEIDFHRTYLFDGNHYHKSNKGFENLMSELWSGKIIYVTDMVKSPSSEAIIKGMKIDLEKMFDVTLVESDEVKDNEFNFIIIQKGSRDPNHKFYPDKLVQHISVERNAKTYYRKDPEKQKEHFDNMLECEKIPASRRSAIFIMLSDFVIKKEVLDGSRTFFDWYQKHIMLAAPSNELDRKWQFYNRTRVVNKDPETKRQNATFSDKMSCLELDTDGSMKFCLLESEDIKDDYHLKLIWNQFNKDQLNLRGILSDGDNTYAFLSTDVTMVPETDMARKKLQENESAHAQDNTTSLTGNIRTKDQFEVYLKACTDVRYCYHKSECYYFVGVNGDNIDSTLHWGANLFRIKTLEGREKIPTMIFDMMLAPFVRLNRYTILPYPFKYLHEYEKFHSLEDILPDEEEEKEETGKDAAEQLCLDVFYAFEERN